MSGEGYEMQQDGDWQHVVPISEDEDFQVVLPSSTRPSQQQQQQQREMPNIQLQSPAPTVAMMTSNSINEENLPLAQRMDFWRQQRESQRSQLGNSISSTFVELAREQPSQMEQDAIQRAMELSMLDFALVDYKQPPQQQHSKRERRAHSVLGLPENASIRQVKSAYRELAKVHHPDKGGDANRFAEIAKAYRTMLTSSLKGSTGALDVSGHVRTPSSEDSAMNAMNIKSTAHWDQELQDHRRLVNDLFQADGMDLNACVSKQLSALDLLGLTFKDAGASNRNELNEIIRNSCFYLSLAASYLWGIGALSHQSGMDDDDWMDESEEQMLVGQTALQLKRTIEAAVVKAHPEWCMQGMVGEEVQAFSDFLVYTLDSPTLLSDWAVVVFDSTSGFCDIYKGQHFEKNTELDPNWGQSNTITLRYVPGHYQPLIPVSADARRPALQDIMRALDDHGVFYVVTDGNS
jgi:DnaJ-domain-containing protein 1